MQFLIDAQLPTRLAEFLNRAGQAATTLRVSARAARNRGPSKFLRRPFRGAVGSHRPDSGHRRESLAIRFVVSSWLATARLEDDDPNGISRTLLRV
ncbi:MAG: hypothetical protein ACR2QA_09040 [Solirubrobacteraceae bacterium]